MVPCECRSSAPVNPNDIFGADCPPPQAACCGSADIAFQTLTLMVGAVLVA